jgi:3-hydroxyisobutyrate dehydrogenase-like beta-hydroxyacid dehydrogenase
VSSLVIACLLVDDTVYKALEPAKTALARRTLVNFTNGTPAQARQMAAWASSQRAGATSTVASWPSRR